MQRSPALPEPALTAASAARSEVGVGQATMSFLAPPIACTRLPLCVSVVQVRPGGRAVGQPACTAAVPRVQYQRGSGLSTTWFALAPG